MRRACAFAAYYGHSAGKLNSYARWRPLAARPGAPGAPPERKRQITALPLLRRLRTDRDGYLQLLVHPADTPAAHRRGGFVIARHGEAAVDLAGKRGMRDVDGNPALAVEPHVDPCVARAVFASKGTSFGENLAGFDVAAHVTRRN